MSPASFVAPPLVSTNTVPAAHRVVVRLAHIGTETPDQIEMGAGLEPGSANQRLCGHGRTGDDVGPTRSMRPDRQRPWPAVRRRSEPPPSPRPCPGSGPRRRSRGSAGRTRGLRPTAAPGGRCRPPEGVRHPRAPERRPPGPRRRPCAAPSAPVRRSAPGAPPSVRRTGCRPLGRTLCRRPHCRERTWASFDADIGPRTPGRHQQHGRVRSVGHGDPVVVTDRRLASGVKHRAQCLDQPRPRRRLPNGLCIDGLHGRSRTLLPGRPYAAAVTMISTRYCG